MGKVCVHVFIESECEYIYISTVLQ